MRNKKMIILAIIVIIFTILNPSMNQFKDFTGSSRNLRRVSNYIFFSIYSQVKSEDDTHTYIGVLMNFIEINKQKSFYQQESVGDSLKTLDSIRSADSMKLGAYGQ